MQCPNIKCGCEESRVLETRVHYIHQQQNVSTWNFKSTPIKVRKRICIKCKEVFITEESTLLNYTKYHINNALKQNRDELANNLQMQLL
jgi:transcriptional regulator NrdR family protein